MPNQATTVVDHPTVMWRMRRQDGLRSHLVIGRQGHGFWAAWFLNAKLLGLRDFGDLGDAIGFSERMQTQNWSIGWRLDDPDESANLTD